jgi:predicted small integral membrane protein
VIIRLIKAMVCFAVALFGLLIAVDNVIDYSTNFEFVQHVLSMDTIPDKRLIGRAITDPAVWRLSYAAIIVGEALTGLFFLAAAICSAKSIARAARAI